MLCQNVSQFLQLWYEFDSIQVYWQFDNVVVLESNGKIHQCKLWTNTKPLPWNSLRLKLFGKVSTLSFLWKKDSNFNRIETFETQNMPTIHLTSLGDPYCIFSYNLFFDLLYHILTRIWIIKEVSNYMYVLRDASFLASHVIIFFYHEQNNICKTATALGNNILKNKYGMLLDYFCNTHKIQPRLEFGHMLVQWLSHLTNYIGTFCKKKMLLFTLRLPSMYYLLFAFWYRHGPERHVTDQNQEHLIIYSYQPNDHES